MASKTQTPSDGDWFRQGLDAILSRYIDSKAHDRFDASHPLWGQAKVLQRTLESTGLVKDRVHLKVRFSFGQGNWARIPWLAFLDNRVAQATSAGVYIIYLFREDMSGIYATLNQGIAKEKGYLGAIVGRKVVRDRADALQVYARHLGDRGFSLSRDLDLHTANSMASDYQHGTIAHRLYETGNLPTTDKLLEDLRALVDVYDAIVASLLKAGTPMQAHHT